MKTKIMIAFLVITLAACAPTQTNTAKVQNTAVAIMQTGVALTQTAMPTATLPPSTFTSTALPTPPGTPTPTLPIISILTPDQIQVERWKEYQTELAKMILRTSGTDSQQRAICEWDILGRSGQEVYVWAICTGNEGPAVIYLESDGSIREVKVPAWTSSQANNKSELFPEDILKKISSFSFGNYPFYSETAFELVQHLNYRETHPEEPPLIVLDKVLTATPTSTPPIILVFTPDTIQMAKWKEYQFELAKAVNCDAGHDCPNENSKCEWDILGRSGQEVYVWALCADLDTFALGESPAVIHLDTDGSVRNVEVPINGSSWKSDIFRLFPADVQAKIDLYPSSERETEIINHFNNRAHPEEPPLIVLSVTPTATPIP